ncbi:MAG: hypothetical protein H6747_12855 [Deltaproteobacteria bacterium]|nr:hypothetical protein [Deltaproteobacteria bacterium]
MFTLVPTPRLPQRSLRRSADALRIRAVIALLWALPSLAVAEPGPAVPPPAGPSEAAPDPDQPRSMQVETAPPGGMNDPVLDAPNAAPARGPLSPGDRATLMRGPISSGEWVLGGILGSWIGFGVGHMVQSRWSDGGFLFTGGQILSLSAMVAGLARGATRELECTEFGCREVSNSNDRWMIVGVSGALAFTVLRVWEIYDVWAGPKQHNQHYEDVRRRTGRQWGVMLLPQQDGGAAATFSLRF